MADTEDRKRIIDMAELAEASSGWYAMVDSIADGTRKYDVGRVLAQAQGAASDAAQAAADAAAAKSAAAQATSDAAGAVSTAQAAASDFDFNGAIDIIDAADVQLSIAEIN